MSDMELVDGIPTTLVQRAREVLETAVKADLSIATAESCTGGLLASLLTDVEGVSSAFERGYVVYSAAAKCELLDIAEEQISSCGVVSAEVARAMAEGALIASHADVALSITGFAGPAGPDDQPGRVHFGCARRDGVTLHEERHFGDCGRGAVRLSAMEVAVDMLHDAVRAISRAAVSA